MNTPSAPQYRLPRFYIEQAAQNPDAFDQQTVRVKGWVYQKRSSGKIKFLVLRDGSQNLQAVLIQGVCEAAALEAFEAVTQESAVEVVGVLKKEPRSSLGVELTVASLQILSLAESYPISPKEHGVEFLMNHRHLWLRSQRQWAALRVRAAIIETAQRFFNQLGFIRFDAPILTPSACEGTSTLFSTPYFEETAYLTQSGQLYGEVGAMAFGKVYVFGPTFRAEKSKTRKHLTEFWMLEPEVAFADLFETMDLGEALVQFVVREILEHCGQELAVLQAKVSDLQKIAQPFPRVSYDEALRVLEKQGMPLNWGEDFGAPHESALGEHFQQPVFVHHMPAQIKAFYFKQVDTLGGVATTNVLGKYALGCDLIAPHGYGEIIGGGQREESATVLEQRLTAHGLQHADYQWYLDLRRYGSVPHAGFGLGLERLVAWITGVEHVRETIPFPRLINTLRP